MHSKTVKRMKYSKKYRFEVRTERIEFTPLSELFSQEDVRKIMRLGIEPHQCHHNSAKVAQYLKCGYCEGVFCGGVLDHAFNVMERNGRKYYFDITNYANTGDAGQTSSLETVLLRTFTWQDINNLFYEFEMAFLTIGSMTFPKIGTFTINDAGEVEVLKDIEDVMKHMNLKIKKFSSVSLEKA